MDKFEIANIDKITKIHSACDAVKEIKSGDNVYFSAFGCSPEPLIECLVDYGRSGKLKDVTIFHTIIMCNNNYADKEFEGIFNVHNFFIGDAMRKYQKDGNAEYIPISLHETQNLFRERHIDIDVALIGVSPPNEHGYISLGLSVDMTLSVVQNAKKVIAVINPNIPRTYGDGLIHIRDIDMFVSDDRPIKEVEYPDLSNIDIAIGQECAKLIDDGACLQLGIGTIPNAILSFLTNHKNLGLHSEMFSDGIIPLAQKGIINGSKKKIDQGKLVACFLMGTHKLHQFIHENPLVILKDVAYTNDPFIIAQNPNVVAINSAIEIDITGQVCADSIGSSIYSGVGGQLDFVYGANRSVGGKSIIAMSSATTKGRSKIVPTLSTGAGVVTPRSMVHYIVTENGCVNLYGKTLQERARLLIGIAHPAAQESLEIAAREIFGKNFKL